VVKVKLCHSVTVLLARNSWRCASRSDIGWGLGAAQLHGRRRNRRDLSLQRVSWKEMGQSGQVSLLDSETPVLGLARTGLIFTGLQKGAQPGGLTPPGQTEQGIPYHVPSCWVPVGGERRGGNSLAARKGSAVVRSERVVLFCWFVLRIPLFLYRCCSCSLCLLFC